MPMFKRDRDPYQMAPAQAATTQAPPPAPQSVAKEAKALPEPEQEARAQTAQPTDLPVNREAAAVVDKNSEVKGSLHSQGDVLIEGCFDGEIEAKETVWVDRSARARAQLRANDVVVSGSFDGQIECRHRLQIAASATVSGQIKTPVLIVEEGATVNCQFSMTKSTGGPK